MALRRISPTLGVLVLGLLVTAGAACVSTSVSPKPPKAPAAAVNGPAPATAAAAARALLVTPNARSISVLLSFILAVFLFLSIHRRLDGGDRRLVAARSGGDVARFR
jgi:hypothetical protein